MPYAPYLYGATVVILILEILTGRHRGIYDRTTRRVTFFCVIGAALSRPLAAILIASVIGFLLPAYKGALSGTDAILAFVTVFTITELAFYWGHRLAHEAKGGRADWFWTLHRTHHSAKFMNVGLTIRIHPLWAFVVPTPWVIGIATYLGLDQAAGYTMLVIYGWNLITHAHFRWDDPIRRHPLFGKAFRALEHVLVSPGIHHSHHGYGKDGGNFRNYAVTLALFDWMFGTLHIPSGRPWRYGIPGRTLEWTEEVFSPFVGERDNSQPATGVAS